MCADTVRYKNLAYVYTEIRGVNDINNNTSKTAEFLLMHEWVKWYMSACKCKYHCKLFPLQVAVVQTSKESKMYLFPTCSLTHELGKK